LKLESLSWSVPSDAVAAYAQDNIVHVTTNTATEIANLSVLVSSELETLSSRIVRNYDVPFIHQLWDTHNNFGGYCACGAASTTMAVAFYDKISPHPMTVNSPTPHNTDYGWYVTEKFTGFDSMYTDSCPRNGKNAYGIYGVTVRDHGYSGIYGGREYIEAALDKLDLNHKRIGFPPSFNDVKAALRRGHLVILSTDLTGAGHIILLKGYTSDGKVIVNDPYGNAFGGTYGKRTIDGANKYYRWNSIKPKWSIEVVSKPPDGSNPPTITHWKGEYYNNRNLNGSPSLVRNDTRINFGWGSGSPASAISSDNFSVRWTRTMRFDRGTYRFRTTSDDGVKLWIDGKLVISAWYDQGATHRYSGNIFLSGGNHTVKMEYYEHGGGATAKLKWWPVGPGSSDGWRAQYYNNRHLNGSPTFTRTDSSIYFNWGSGGPGNGVSSDNFSVRWTKTLNVPRSGYYRFYTRTDDGVRLWVDGRLRISSWRDQGATTHYSYPIHLSKGNHDIKVEYYEHGGAAYVRAWMQPLFKNEYFNNTSLSGSPRSRWYSTYVWYNWGYGSPSRYIRRYNFSARYQGSVYLSGGRYRFCTRTDDGVRLYIDGQRVINRWRDQGATTYCTTRSLSKGFHDIKMEYYEHFGWATAKMWWKKQGGWYFSDPLQVAADQSVRPTEDATEEDLLAIYNDAGYLGPVIEADVSNAEPGIYQVLLPMAITE
jgi:hypothetical protein